jgi:TetR/AcrR family transcriptional regulator, mexCD-oprJ operon repressor
VLDHRRAVAERNLEAILAAAERLLERRAPATISAVAAEAGLSRVTVYAHFPTRELLLEAVAERALRMTAAAADEARVLEGPADEALDRLAIFSLHGLERHAALVEATGEQLSADARRRLHEDGLAGVRRLLERGREEGSIRRDLPVEWLLACFYVLVHGAADEVRAGRLAQAAVPEVLRTSFRDLFLCR